MAQSRVRRTQPAEIQVSVSEIGSELRVYRLPRTATVRDALGMAGINGGARDVRVNNKPAELTARLTDGAVVTAIEKVQGGA